MYVYALLFTENASSFGCCFAVFGPAFVSLDITTVLFGDWDTFLHHVFGGYYLHKKNITAMIHHLSP